jgi:hypothetical protein
VRVAEPPEPPAVDTGRGDLKGTTYELFILAVSLLSIVNLGLVAVFPWQSQPWLLVVYIDTALTLIPA